jgi:hypothetical protein
VTGLGPYPWIAVEAGVPRPTAVVWAAVQIGDQPAVPVIAQRRTHIARQRAVWIDVRSRRPLEQGKARVTHWRGLQVPDPPPNT